MAICIADDLTSWPQICIIAPEREQSLKNKIATPNQGNSMGSYNGRWKARTKREQLVKQCQAAEIKGVRMGGRGGRSGYRRKKPTTIARLRMKLRIAGQIPCC